MLSTYCHALYIYTAGHEKIMELLAVKGIQMRTLASPLNLETAITLMAGKIELKSNSSFLMKLIKYYIFSELEQFQNSSIMPGKRKIYYR